MAFLSISVKVAEIIDEGYVQKDSLKDSFDDSSANLFKLGAENIFLGRKAATKEEAIRFAGEQLVKGGYVEPEYVQAMLDREKLTPTYLGESIAVPHGTVEAKDRVLKTGVVFCQYPEGVRFGEEEDDIARLVIGIAARNNEHIQVITSLTNALVGEKVAIVSNKAQTTRNRIYGIVNRGDTQFILLDTPGLHKPKSALGDYMVKVVTSSLADVDCALLLVEPIPHVGAPEKALIERVKEEKIPCILCINKIDTVEPAELLPVIAAYNEAWDGFDAIIPISAHSRSGLDDLMQELQKYAQEGPQLFPDGETTDQPERQVMGELLREKLLLCLDKEIPHGTAVEITKFSERDSGVVDVDATIYCEKASHKGIIIGKQGTIRNSLSLEEINLVLMLSLAKVNNATIRCGNSVVTQH